MTKKDVHFISSNLVNFFYFRDVFLVLQAIFIAIILGSPWKEQRGGNGTEHLHTLHTHQEP